MKREILFRGKTKYGSWIIGDLLQYANTAQIWTQEEHGKCNYIVDPATVGQFTGLTDKNGFTKIFEGDIIRLDGTIGGNIYEEKELLKDTTNLIIKGVGTSSWATTEQEAIMRGCHYAE